MKIKKLVSILRDKRWTSDDLDYIDWLENQISYEQYETALQMVKERMDGAEQG